MQGERAGAGRRGMQVEHRLQRATHGGAALPVAQCAPAAAPPLAARLFVQLLIDRDRAMYYAPEDVPCTSRTTTLNEELGQVRHMRGGGACRGLARPRACAGRAPAHVRLHCLPASGCTRHLSKPAF